MLQRAPRLRPLKDGRESVRARGAERPASGARNFLVLRDRGRGSADAGRELMRSAPPEASA